MPGGFPGGPRLGMHASGVRADVTLPVALQVLERGDPAWRLINGHHGCLRRYPTIADLGKTLRMCPGDVWTVLKEFSIKRKTKTHTFTRTWQQYFIRCDIRKIYNVFCDTMLLVRLLFRHPVFWHNGRPYWYLVKLLNLESGYVFLSLRL
jgi:hypothetical protein